MSRLRAFGAGLYMAIVLAFLFLPLIAVFANAVNSDPTLTAWGGFTTEWFTGALGDRRVRDDFLTSVTIALIVTLISLLIATTAAIWTRKATRRGLALMDASTYMRLVLPEIVIAVGLFLLFRRLELPLGTEAIVAGHVVVYSAFATVIMQARIATIGDTLEQAAMDLGATPFRAFRRVLLPQLVPALAVSALLVFTFSMDNVVISFLLGGGNTETLPVLLLGLVRRTVTPEVNAIAALVLAVTLITFLAAVLIAGARSARLIAGADHEDGKE